MNFNLYGAFCGMAVTALLIREDIARSVYPEPPLVQSAIFVIVRTNHVTVTGIGPDRKLMVYYADWSLRCTTGPFGRIVATNQPQRLTIINQ